MRRTEKEATSERERECQENNVPRNYANSSKLLGQSVSQSARNREKEKTKKGRRNGRCSFERCARPEIHFSVLAFIVGVEISALPLNNLPEISGRDMSVVCPSVFNGFFASSQFIGSLSLSLARSPGSWQFERDKEGRRRRRNYCSRNHFSKQQRMGMTRARKERTEEQSGQFCANRGMHLI